MHDCVSGPSQKLLVQKQKTLAEFIKKAPEVYRVKSELLDEITIALESAVKEMTAIAVTPIPLSTAFAHTSPPCWLT